MFRDLYELLRHYKFGYKPFVRAYNFGFIFTALRGPWVGTVFSPGPETVKPWKP